jgi:hypothetical protein
VAELNFPIDKESHMVFDLVKEFLQNAGQGQMIVQVSFVSTAISPSVTNFLRL